MVIPDADKKERGTIVRKSFYIPPREYKGFNSQEGTCTAHAALVVTYQKLLQRHRPKTSFGPADASLVVVPRPYQATWSVVKRKCGYEEPHHHYFFLERKTSSIAASIPTTSEKSLDVLWL
jgi:hypothetical protein